MSKKTQIRNSTAEFLIFTTQSAEKSIEARYEDETIWLSQKLMATLFEVEVNTINYHLKEIFKAEELQENSVIRKFRITAAFLLISFPSALPSSRFCPGQLAAGSFCFSTWRCFYQWRWC